MEWTLLLAAIAIPSYWIFKMLLELMLAHYRMIQQINSLPFP